MIIGGWQITDTTNWSSGLPWTPTLSNCGSEINSSAPCRPNVGNVGRSTSGPKDSIRSTTWFGTSRRRPLVARGSILARVRSAMPTSIRCTDRDVFTDDMSISKNFKITERFQLKFQMDAFNVFNHPALNFSKPKVVAELAWPRVRQPVRAVLTTARSRTSCGEPRCGSCSSACICSSSRGATSRSSRRESSGSLLLFFGAIQSGAGPKIPRYLGQWYRHALGSDLRLIMNLAVPACASVLPSRSRCRWTSSDLFASAQQPLRQAALGWTRSCRPTSAPTWC